MHKTIIDLTQMIDKGIPDWNGCCGFQMKQVMDYAEGACVQKLEMPNGIGTHMDAPSHFIEGGIDIAGIGIDQSICPGVVIDVSSKADQYHALSVNDVSEFEVQHGEIPEKFVVIIHTGWGNSMTKGRHHATN